MIDQLPVLIVIIPLFAGLLITILGKFNEKWSQPIAVVSLFLSFLCTLQLGTVISQTGSTVNYKLGNWPPPIGIEFAVDHLNILVLALITFSATLAAIFSRQSVLKELGDRVPEYYTLFVLFCSGLLGITITGDAFNLYVMLEVAALTSYALLAMNRGKASMATFNYLIMGTIGACLYLLGVGYLLIKTGSLNMANIAELLLPIAPYSNAILVAFALIMIGMWIKMALFPLHGWLPNVYSRSPIASATLIAPLMTKVSVYVMVRMMMTVFGPDYAFNQLNWATSVVTLATIAIVSGSFLALRQRNFRRMITYLIVAEIGYMVGGAWLGNSSGMTGTIYHILADGVMTLALFMIVGCISFKLKNTDFENFKGLFHKMPYTMIFFLITFAYWVFARLCRKIGNFDNSKKHHRVHKTRE